MLGGEKSCALVVALNKENEDTKEYNHDLSTYIMNISYTIGYSYS